MGIVHYRHGNMGFSLIPGGRMSNHDQRLTSRVSDLRALASMIEYLSTSTLRLGKGYLLYPVTHPTLVFAHISASDWVTSSLDDLSVIGGWLL